MCEDSTRLITQYHSNQDNLIHLKQTNLIITNAKAISHNSRPSHTTHTNKLYNTKACLLQKLSETPCLQIALYCVQEQDSFRFTSYKKLRTQPLPKWLVALLHCKFGCFKKHESQYFNVEATKINVLFYQTKLLQKKLGFLQKCGSAHCTVQILKF